MNSNGNQATGRGARVFMTQYPHRVDRMTQRFVPSKDMSPAQEFGHVIEILPPEASTATGNPAEVWTAVVAMMAELDFNPDEDYFLPVGDVLGCCMVTTVLMRKFETVSVLKWNGQTRRYSPHTLGE